MKELIFTTKQTFYQKPPMTNEVATKLSFAYTLLSPKFQFKQH